MALEKLKAVTGFLIERNFCDQNQLDSWMEDGRVMPASKNTGNGFLICRLEYDAIISIEKFSSDPNLLFALVSVWLMDNDAAREDENLPPPEVVIDVLDAKTADVEIKVTFREDIYLVEDATGIVPFNGMNWNLSAPEVDIADEIAVGHDQNLSTDKPYLYGDPQ